MNPPVDTATSYRWHRSMISLTADCGINVNDPPANFNESTYAPMVSRMSSRYRLPIGVYYGPRISVLPVRRGLGGRVFERRNGSARCSGAILQHSFFPLDTHRSHLAQSLRKIPNVHPLDFRNRAGHPVRQ